LWILSFLHHGDGIHGGRLVKELIENIQNHEPLGPSLRAFIRRYPWTVAFTILFIAMGFGFWRVEQIDKARESERTDRRAEFLVRDQQFCRAIPNVAVANAQALINVVILQAIRDGRPKSDIEATRERGKEYTSETRRLALEQLPECPRILVTPPPTTP
jgi:hypothetical protein